MMAKIKICSFLKKFIFNWRIIALQCCIDFCLTTPWISHMFTCIPFLLNLPPKPHPTPPDHHRTPSWAPSVTLPLPTSCFTHSSVKIRKLIHVNWLDSFKNMCYANLCGGEGNGNPLQYSCLEESMDRGDWQATIHEVTESRTRLND